MQTIVSNLEHRVEDSATNRPSFGKIGQRFRNAVYAARHYITIGIATIGLSIGAAGCDSGGDDDDGGSNCSACPACQHNYVVVCSNDQDGLSCGCSYSPPDPYDKGY